VRLSDPGTASTSELVEHRRAVWDSIAVRVQSDRLVLLTGVGVYAPRGGGSGESLVCVDARPMNEKPLRKIDVETKLEADFEGTDKRKLTLYAKVK
jgi:hypothetical protein